MQADKKCYCTSKNHVNAQKREMDTPVTHMMSMRHRQIKAGHERNKHPYFPPIQGQVILPTADRESEGLLWSLISHT
jgi:hypothetical protein